MLTLMLLTSRNRPDAQESRGGCRALREHIREDAGLDESNAEGEARNRLEDTDQEAAAVTRSDKDVDSQQ